MITTTFFKSYNKRQSGLWKSMGLALALLVTLMLALPAWAQQAAGPDPRKQQLEVAREYAKRSDWAKAAETYKPLSKDPTLIGQVWPGYLEALRNLKDYDEAERYLKKLAK